MGLLRWGLLVSGCAALLVGDAGASFPGRNGSIVYASRLLPAPASGVVELQLGSRVVRRSLTARTGISGLLPVESPDGRMVAYVRGGRLYVSEPDGGASRDFGRGARPAWSPDGRKLAFSIWDPYQTVVVVDVETRERRTFGEGSNPTWSPDGDRLAFVHYLGLGVVNADGTGRRFIWEQSMPDWYHLDAPAWSPDGRWLAFSPVSQIYDGEPDSAGIVVVELATGAVSSSREWARHPSWSPTGASLVYVRTRGRKVVKEIVRLDAERGARQVLATIPFSRVCEARPALSALALGASYSPTGNRIAFASSARRKGRCQVAVGIVVPGSRARIVHTEPLGSRPAGFINDDIAEPGPRWLRDGSGLRLGIGRRTLQAELYLRREDGTEIRRLTHSPASEQDPRFSPDGRRIVFVRGSRGRDGVIWITDALGKHPRVVGRGSYPTWSPDGRRIAFCRRDALYTVSAAGGRPRRLARGPAAMPSWSPDGQLIAFARAGAAIEREPLEARSAGIFSVDLRTRRLRRLTQSAGLFPNWSPNGQLVAYTLWDREPSGLYEYPYLRLVSRAGAGVEPGDRYVFAYDVAWAPSGDKLVGSASSGSTLLRIRPPVLSGGSAPLPVVPIPSLLGIHADERDPDWQPR